MIDADPTHTGIYRRVCGDRPLEDPPVRCPGPIPPCTPHLRESTCHGAALDRLPRIHGNRPTSARRRMRLDSSTPRMRGSTDSRTGRPVGNSVTPSAGVNQRRHEAERWSGSPPARGSTESQPDRQELASPLNRTRAGSTGRRMTKQQPYPRQVRGWTQDAVPERGAPARAGIDRRQSASNVRSPPHPAHAGDRPTMRDTVAALSSPTPPRPRGDPRAGRPSSPVCGDRPISRCRRPENRETPASAGMDHRVRRSSEHATPHARG